MVIGVIGTVIRLGTVLYRVAKTSNRFPKTMRVLRRQGAYEGAQYGAGLGAFVANVEYYFEQEGRLDGIPSQIKQRNGNRFRKTRSSLFKSARNRCYPKKRYNRRSR